jgi:hypothetical protein
MLKLSTKQLMALILIIVLIAAILIFTFIYGYNTVLDYLKNQYAEIIIAVILAIIVGLIIEYIYRYFSPKSKILKTTMTHKPNKNGDFAKLILPNNNNIVITGAERIMGREDFLGIVPTDKLLFIGKNHFKITNMENGFYIEDLDTKNGTFVNNDKLQAFKKRKLHEGDEIVIANLHIKYFEKSHLR